MLPILNCARKKKRDLTTRRNVMSQKEAVWMGVCGTELEHAEGLRVSCDRERGTVRYAGPVPPTAGLWLGVEWDNPERGKHDGTHEGVQYFTCRHPKGGSFVRPAKVSFGVDFLTAVGQVYQASDSENEPSQDTGFFKELEWSKGRSTQSLTSVLLERCEVNGPGAAGEIRKTTPNVKCLDMSDSLLTCWEDVAAITQQLDQLETLQLINSRLSLPSDVSAHCRSFCSLKVLVLNKCGLTWPQVLALAPMWPQLQDLHLGENDITELQRPDGVLQCLKSLDVSCNRLEQRSVLNLAALPRLEKLNVSVTGLSDLHFEDAAAGCETSMFSSLTYLNVSDNNITEWSVVDELGKLSSLVELSCRGNKLLSVGGNRMSATETIIAKLERLQVLNRCTISPDVRKGAESVYIKRFADCPVTSQHPRYQSLISKYGAPDEDELRKPVPFALKNQLLKIKFVFPDAADRKPIEKKLPASMVVQKVKGLLYRLLKVPAVDLKLSYTSSKATGTEYEIDNDLNTLNFYAIEDGDHVLVRWS